MNYLTQHQLYLFFTKGTSLVSWQATGTMAREARIYQEIAPHLAGVTFVTYGKRSDLSLSRELGGIQVRCNHWGLHPRLYPPLLAHVLPRFWPGPAIYKSNQVKGAEVMLAAARHTGARSITRAGYLPSNIAAWDQGYDSPEAQRMRALEARVFGGADRVVVTTQAMADTVLGRYRVDPGRLRVIPNYVDTDLFSPAESPRASKQLCYVGRLHREKNLDSLFTALEGLGVELVLIGEGELRGHLEERARREGLNVRFLGRVPNAELPGHLNRATAFVFPSLGEHHPKSLIEAMSCGAPVIACQVPGVRELVEHGRSGWLCGTSPAELRQAIETVLGDASLRERLGRAARKYCLEHFTVERVVGLELDLLRELAG